VGELVHQELRPLGAPPWVACRAELDVPRVALQWQPNARLAVVPPPEPHAGSGVLAWAQPQAREEPQAPLASPLQDLAPQRALPVPPAARQAQRGPAQHSLPEELLSPQQEPTEDGLPAHVPQGRALQGHVPPVCVLQGHALQVYRRRAQRVSAEPGLPHAARAALARLLLPLLSRRARHRLLLRHRQHPSSGAGLVPQLRRGWSWSAFSFRLRQIPEEGQ